MTQAGGAEDTLEGVYGFLVEYQIKGREFVFVRTLN